MIKLQAEKKPAKNLMFGIATYNQYHKIKDRDFLVNYKYF